MKEKTHGPWKFSSGRLKKLSACLSGYVSRGELAGLSALIWHAGSTAFEQFFGLADIEADCPIQKDTIFRIASMTKPITAIAIMMLYEEGRLHLNTPVREFIPEFKDLQVCRGENQDGAPELEPLQRDITIRHLFTHSAGFSSPRDQSKAVGRSYFQRFERYRSGGEQRTMASIRDDLGTLPLAFQPGTAFDYGMSTDVLGLLVEIISGQRFDQYLQENVFDPLRMGDTRFFVPASRLGRVATVYRRPSGSTSLEPTGGPPPPSKLPTYPSPAGGLVSTLGDYARFCEMMINGGHLDDANLLSPTTVEMFSMNHMTEEALRYFEANEPGHMGYGYGLASRVLIDPSKSNGYGSEGEFGWVGALNTCFWIDPKESLFAILLTQYALTEAPPIWWQFKQLTYQAVV